MEKAQVDMLLGGTCLALFLLAPFLAKQILKYKRQSPVVICVMLSLCNYVRLYIYSCSYNYQKHTSYQYKFVYFSRKQRRKLYIYSTNKIERAFEIVQSH